MEKCRVVVGAGIDRHAQIGADLAVGGQGEGDEQRRPVDPAVGGEGGVLLGPLGQVRRILAPPCRARAFGSCPAARDVAAHPSGVDLGYRLVPVEGVFPVPLGLVALGLHVGPELDQPSLVVGGGMGFGDGFGLQVPALAALGFAQLLVAGGARRALGFLGSAAGDVERLGHAGVGVQAPQFEGADADPVEFGDLDCHVQGEVQAVTDEAGQGAVEATAGMTQSESDRAPYCIPAYIAMETGATRVLLGEAPRPSRSSRPADPNGPSPVRHATTSCS